MLFDPLMPQGLHTIFTTLGSDKDKKKNNVKVGVVVLIKLKTLIFCEQKKCILDHERNFGGNT